jgi:hypothetical protein
VFLFPHLSRLPSNKTSADFIFHHQFLPVLGRLIASRIEGTLSPELVEKFSIKRDRGPFKNWGWFAEPRDLMKEELCEKEDLVAPKETGLSEVRLDADECSHGIALLKV